MAVGGNSLACNLLAKLRNISLLTDNCFEVLQRGIVCKIMFLIVQINLSQHAKIKALKLAIWILFEIN